MTQLAFLDLPSQSRKPDLHITLDWPPSVNRTYGQFAVPPALERIKARYATNGWEGFYQWLRKATRVGGKKHDSVRTYTEAVAWALKMKRTVFGADDVAAWLVFHPPTARKPDMDNRQKQIFDAAQWAHVVDNDNQFADYRVTRGDPVPGGSVEFMMWRI